MPRADVQPSYSTAAGPPRVLFINDSPDERQMYVEWFEREGFCTFQADTADDGFRLAAESPPTVVITDVRIGNGDDGLELTRRLKHDERLQHVPVVILTGYVLGAARQNAEQAGCDLFVTKPCLPDELVNKIAGLLGGQR